MSSGRQAHCGSSVPVHPGLAAALPAATPVPGGSALLEPAPPASGPTVPPPPDLQMFLLWILPPRIVALV